MKFCVPAIAVLSGVCISVPAEACEHPALWWSNQTSSTGVTEFGAESLRLTGGFLSGELEGNVALPEEGAWTIHFRAHTDETDNLPTESISVFVNDEFVTQVFNTPPLTVFTFEHPIIGDSFSYRFEFQSPSPSFTSHMVMDPGFVRVECPGDLDHDCVVDTDDLLQLLAAWGACDACDEDIDESGSVDVTDLLQLLAAWGDCVE